MLFDAVYGGFDGRAGDDVGHGVGVYAVADLGAVQTALGIGDGSAVGSGTGCRE